MVAMDHIHGKIAESSNLSTCGQLCLDLFKVTKSPGGDDAASLREYKLLCHPEVPWHLHGPLSQFGDEMNLVKNFHGKKQLVR